MRLGSKAKLTIAVGLTAASAFLALGVRESRNASAATVQGEAAPVRVAAPVLLVRAARAIRTGETITAAMIRNAPGDPTRYPYAARSDEHTPELQSLMRISYAVFCLKRQKKHDRSRDRQSNRPQ